MRGMFDCHLAEFVQPTELSSSGAEKNTLLSVCLWVTMGGSNHISATQGIS